MDDEPEKVSECQELYIHDGVLVKSHTLKENDVDFTNNLGTLSVVEYGSDLGKCIEWHQCDVSIEDDQEWAIVKGCENGIYNEKTKNSKPPAIQIPLKNLISFEFSENHQELKFVEQGKTESTIFYFQNGHADRFVCFLKGNLNTVVSKKYKHLYKVTEQTEDLERSFSKLDLFSDDNTKSDAVWSFLKKLHDHPYETTMNAFAKVTDTLLYKPQSPETDAELLNSSFSADEVSDFHGRISAEDYELITKGPPLPPRTVPCRSTPLTLEQWQFFFDENGRILDSETVKKIIFHGGVSPVGNLRPEVWKFLLGYYPWNSTFAEREVIKKQKREEYFTMKLQWTTMSSTQEDNFMAYKERKSLIEKDVCRTDRKKEYFSAENKVNLEVLQDILMTYLMYNFDLGYVQGMSDLLSPLLVQLNDEVEAFWCFVEFMNRVKRNFDMDQAGMKQQLQQLYCLMCCIEPELASYLKHHDSSNMAFCFRWLLIWFKREFSFEDIYILWEVLWTEALCKNFHLLICAAILDSEKETLMTNNYGFTEILKHINELAEKINLNQILRKAEGIYIQLSSAAKIPSTIKKLIGLECSPEPDNSDSECESSCNGVFEYDSSMSKPKYNGVSNQNTPYITEDSTELAFDNSITLQYL